MKSRTTKPDANPSNDDSEILRSFLVSLSEDWRALVIRSAACLYRLMGIVDVPDSSGSSERMQLRVEMPVIVYG